MSGLLPAIRPKNFKEKPYFRKLKAQVDGSAKVEHALTQITGVGRRFAQAVVMTAGIDLGMRIGALPEKDLNRIEEIILNPIENGIPNWMINRKNDLRDGMDKHLIGNQLVITVRRDVERMKKIKSYKGVRHHFHKKVRGQRTKSTGRHGLVVGVMRMKKAQKKQV